MTLARFKDLCLDATDVPALAAFWGHALDMTPDTGREDGVGRLIPGAHQSSEEALWLNPVPEPRAVKTRVHLDLRLALADPSGLLAAGAQLVTEPGPDGWWVLADPEGNEFCAFPPRDNSRHGVSALVVDAADPVAQARWWARVVGGTVTVAEESAALVGAAGFPWDTWLFNAVPEPKKVKNRMHWDVTLADAEPRALLDAGASLLREPDGDVDWWLLADPEDNEFCAFAPPVMTPRR